jgi:D-alanyl-lipoteichoic acid acyltransferase DltB (MBOAT superfamily)
MYLFALIAMCLAGFVMGITPYFILKNKIQNDILEMKDKFDINRVTQQSCEDVVDFISTFNKYLI